MKQLLRYLSLLLLPLYLGGCEMPAGLLEAISPPHEPGLSPGKKRTHSLPLNNPPFVAAAVASHMEPEDMIIGIVVRGQAHAYPWWIVRNYHVINDTLVISSATRAAGGSDWDAVTRVPPPSRYNQFDSYIPVLINLCEACSGAAAFIPGINGSVDQPLVFSQCRSRGSTGAFNAIGVYTICDYQTHSRWHPFTGKAESGSLAGKRLQRIPVAVERWDVWLKEHPDTLVTLAGREMRHRTHGNLPGGVMGGANSHPTYRKWVELNPEKEDTRLAANELVLGIASDDGEYSYAFPLELLRSKGGLATFEFRGKPYLMLLAGTWRASAFSRTLDGSTLDFDIESLSPLRLRDSSGSIWNELGEAISGPHKGRSIAIVADSYLAEWSDWIMAHPDSTLAQP